MDLYQGTCREFSKVFSEDLASFQDINDKIQHHADALTNCLKLVLSNPDSKSVQTLWMWLIRSSVKFLLWIDSQPSSACLKLFVDKIRPWLMEQNFKGLCCKELTDMYNLAVKGPWSHPALKKLLAGEESSLKELQEVFVEGLECVEFHMASLLFAGKTNEFILFAKAAIVHPQVQKNKVVQKVYQEHISDILKEEDLICRMKDFDLGITVSLLEDSMKAGRKCENLCNAAVKYLLKNKEMKYLEEILSCWIKLVLSKHQNTELFDKIEKNFLESETTVISVQQCVVLARVLWKVVGNKGRMMCVEILCRALQLLSSDEQDSDELKKGILSSIAYFLPNSQVARFCTLTLFIINPTVDHYFEVAKTYKIPYDRDKDLAIDFKAHLRLTLLEYLQQQWPQSFLQSSSWDWPLLRNVCYNMLSNDDLAVVQLEEQEEESRETSSQPTYESHDTSSASEVFPFEEATPDSKCPAESDKDYQEANTSGSVDICDCVACKMKQQQVPGKDEASLVHHSPVSKRHQVSKPSAPHTLSCPRKSSHKKEHFGSEESFTCPEERCQRALKSKTGMTKHLSKTHRWTMSEIQGYYFSVESLKSNSSKPNSKHVTVLGDTVELNNNEGSPKISATGHSSSNSPSEMQASDTPERIVSGEPGAPMEVDSKSATQNLDISPTAVIHNTNDDRDIEMSDIVAEKVISLEAEAPIKDPADPKDLESIKIASNLTNQTPISSSDTVGRTSPGDMTHEILKDVETSVSQSSATSQSNFMTHPSVLPPLDPIFETETLAPIFVKETLNPIFVTESNPEEKKVSDAVEEQQKDGEFACPVKYCDRVYKHRHTVQEHLEFRHKYSPEEAAKMALSATYICQSAVPPPPPKNESTRTSQADIRHARGWYWAVDEFLGKEMTEKHFRHNQMVDSNFRFSLECDIIYTLGRAPLSYKSEQCATEIISDWKFAEKHREKQEKEKTPPPNERDGPGKVLAEKLQTATISTVNVSQKLVQKAIVTSNHKPSGARAKSLTAPLSKAKKSQKDKGMSNFPAYNINKTPSLNTSDIPIPGKRPASCQTGWKTGEKFHKADHYHNLPEAQTKKLRRSKKQEYPIAITIVAGSFVCRETRTIASQCCQSESKQAAIPATVPKKKTATVKRKSSTDVYAKPLFSPTAETFNPPTSKQIKRKYDAQTVYHLADKYSDMIAEPEESSAALAASNSKPSFADALNSVNMPVVQVPEKPKAKRKSSKSIEIVKVDDVPTFQKPRGSAATTSSSRSSDVGAGDGTSSKKPKPKKSKGRSLSSSLIKKYSVSSDLLVKRRVDDLSRQLFPSHDYEELLKQAEEISSSVKPKPIAKPLKTPTNVTPRVIQPTPALPSLTTKPIVPKTPITDDTNPTSNNSRVPAIITSTPIPLPKEDDDDVPKKKAPKSVSGKRRIDLRKLSSISKQIKETSVSQDGGNSSDENSVSEHDSASSFSSYLHDTPATEEPASIAEAFEKDDLMAAQSVRTDIVCPECSKSMSSAFALTCHMRRRHKVRSKKMFFPGQTVDVPHNLSESTDSKSTKKAPKNVQGPPEDTEACSRAATFRLARNQTTASTVSTLSDDVTRSNSVSYSADISEVSEDDISDNGAYSDIKARKMVPVSKFVKVTVRPDPTSEKLKTTVSRVLDKLVASVVTTLGHISASRTLLDVADDDTKQIESSSDIPNPVSRPSDSVIIYKSLPARPASESSSTCTHIQVANPAAVKISQPCGLAIISDNIPDAETAAVKSSQPSGLAVLSDNIRDAEATAAKSNQRSGLAVLSDNSWVAEPAAVKRGQRSGLAIISDITWVDEDAAVKSVQPSGLAILSDNIRFAEAAAVKNSQRSGLPILSDNARQPISEAKSSKPNEEGPQLSTSYVVYEGFIFKCKMPNCSSKCKRYKSIRDHFRVKHRFEFNQVHWKSVSSYSNKAVPKRNPQEETSLLEDVDPLPVTSKEPAVAVRRSAYNEASLQIQLSSVNLSPRRWSQHQELMRLYNKRVRRKVAQALSPAQRTRKKLYKGKLYKKRTRKESDASTDSYDADYEAQLPCWCCEAVFHCRKNLSLHIRHHILNIDLCEHRCDYPGCLYGFRTQHELDCHQKAHNYGRHLCLFCPNQSRAFPSFRKLVVHEHVAHSNIKTDLLRLRKNFCLKSVRNWGRPWKLSDVEVESSEEEDMSFLAGGHRRTQINAESCLLCAKNALQPSVAGSCDHEVINMIISDVLETVVEYECLYNNNSLAIIAAARRNNPLPSIAADTTPELDDGNNREHSYLKANGNDNASTGPSNELRDMPFVNEPILESISVQHLSKNPFAAENCSKKAVEYSPSDEMDMGLSGNLPILGADSSPVRSTVDLFSPPRLPEITGFDYDIALEVIHTVHKLVCDVEIEEQANYIRLCGFVPTGVMYYKQCDLLNSPGVALSVYGYNSEAFVALDMANNAKPPSCLTSSSAAAVNSPDATSMLRDELPHCSKDPAGASCSSDIQSSSSGPKDEGSSLTQATSEWQQPFAADLPSSSQISQPTLPASSESPFASLTDCPSLLQAKLISICLNRDCHPMWRLDADEAHSDICDIKAFDDVSRLFFCQHYVVPSRLLNLPRPPLRGICTVYPVTTDLPRHTAFTSDFVVVNPNAAPDPETYAENSFHQQQLSLSPDNSSSNSTRDFAQTRTKLDQEVNATAPQNEDLRAPTIVSDSKSDLEQNCNDPSQLNGSGKVCEPVSLYSSPQYMGGKKDDVINTGSDVVNTRRDVVNTGSDIVNTGNGVSNENTIVNAKNDVNKSGNSVDINSESDVDAISVNDVGAKCGNEENIDPALQVDQEETREIVSNDNGVCTPSPNLGQDQPISDHQNAENPYFDSFMDEIRRGKAAKATKKKKSAFLKPTNIFTKRGRPRKSCDIIGKKTATQRRSMSEIVAFCDTPEVVEELLRARVPKKMKKRTKKELVADKDLSKTTGSNLNPVVEINPLSISPSQKLRKMKKIKQIKNKLLKQRVKITNLKKVIKKKSENEAGKKKSAKTKHKSDPDRKKDKLLDSKSARKKSKKKYFSLTVEDKAEDAEPAQGAIEISDAEDNLPLSHLEGRSSSVLTDHCYALSSPSKSVPNDDAAEEPLDENKIEVSDYGEEILIEQTNSMEESTAVVLTESEPLTPHSTRNRSFDNEVTVDLMEVTQPQSRQCVEDLIMSSSPLCNEGEKEKKIEPQTNPQTGDTLKLSAFNPPGRVPCIFCPSWFATIQLCKTHFKDVHANELVEYKKQAKSMLITHKRSFLLTAAANSAKKRLAKSNVQKQKNQLRQYFNKRFVKPVNILPAVHGADPSALSQSPLSASSFDKDILNVLHKSQGIKIPQIHSQVVIGHTADDVTTESDVVQGGKNQKFSQNFSLEIYSKPQTTPCEAEDSQDTRVPSNCAQQTLSFTNRVLVPNRKDAPSCVESSGTENAPSNSSMILPRNVTNSLCRFPVVSSGANLIPTATVALKPTRPMTTMLKKSTKSFAIVAPTFRYSASQSSAAESPQKSTTQSRNRIAAPSLPLMTAAIVGVNASPRLLTTRPSEALIQHRDLPLARVTSPLPSRPSTSSPFLVSMGTNNFKRHSNGSSTRTTLHVPTLASKSTCASNVDKPPISRLDAISTADRIRSSITTNQVTSASSTIAASDYFTRDVSTRTQLMTSSATQSGDTVLACSFNTDKSLSESISNAPRRSNFVTIPDEIAAKKRRIESISDKMLNRLIQPDAPKPTTTATEPKQSAESSSNAVNKPKSLLYCPFCTSVHPSPNNYKKHMMSIHSLHICTRSYCNKLFSNEIELENHTHSKHNFSLHFETGRKPNLTEDEAPSAYEPHGDMTLCEYASIEAADQSTSTTTSSVIDQRMTPRKAGSEIVDTAEVWNSNISQEELREMHEKLLKYMSSLSKEEFLRLVLFDVRGFAKRCHVLLDESDDEVFMRCPIASCRVIGEAKRNLYNHMIKEHQLGPILAWIRKRDANRRRRLRAMEVKRNQMQENDDIFFSSPCLDKWENTSSQQSVPPQQNAASNSSCVNVEISSLRKNVDLCTTIRRKFPMLKSQSSPGASPHKRVNVAIRPLPIQYDSSRFTKDQSGTAHQPHEETEQRESSVESSNSDQDDDKNFKCRFSKCGKTIGGQSNFTCHMLSHSPSRIAWHEEKGKLWPLFKPVVIISRDKEPILRAQEQGVTESETVDDVMESISTPLSASADTRDSSDLELDAIRTGGLSCPKRHHSTNSSPRSPLVVLRKLSSFN